MGWVNPPEILMSFPLEVTTFSTTRIFQDSGDFLESRSFVVDLVDLDLPSFFPFLKKNKGVCDECVPQVFVSKRAPKMEGNE